MAITSIRVGQGWDNHRIVPGRPLLLGGIKIDSDFGFDGHSDADVLAHAITDALLGSLALGDIGLHFPDTDPRWQGCDSMVFLKHAAGLVREQGYSISNIDATVILQRPKLKDYRLSIRENLARVLDLEVGVVGIKFKTAEKVGPVGEGLSGEAQAVVLIMK